MFTKIIRIPYKLVKFIIISIIVLFSILISLPYIFPDYISVQIKSWANDHIQTELSFTKATLSFLEHFPSLTLTLHDFSLKGSAPFEKNMLVAAKKVSMGVNLFSLFGSSVKINEVYLSDGKINVLVNEAGVPNYNVYTTSTSQGTNKNAGADTSNASLKLEKIQIEECELAYHDASIPFKLTSSKLNYTGKGGLHKMVFDLKSKLQMKDVSLSYDNENYFINKQLRARLVTKVNTGSLQLVFEKNNLKINELPVRFKGRFDFLANGYYMDFNLATRKATFKQLFTALPPSALKWLDRTTVKGNIELTAQLKGKYAVSENVAPDLNLSLKVNKGSIASDQTKTPIQNILLQLQCSIPRLSPGLVHLKVDSIYASLDKQFVAGAFELKGTDKPFIKGHIAASADVGQWNKTLSTESFADVKGTLNVKAAFNGIFDKPSGRLPVMLASLNYKNGYIKTNYYPNGINDINVDVSIQNASGSNKDLIVTTSPIAFSFEGKPFTIISELKNLENLQYNINSKGVIDIGRIYKVFAIEGYNADGSISTDLELIGSQADITAKRFDKLQHRGTLQLHQINISSYDFPKPLMIDKGIFRIQNEKLVAENIHCIYGSTHAKMQGHLTNILNYILLENAPLQGKLTVKADLINLEELMSSTTNTAAIEDSIPDDTISTGIVLIPGNLDLELIAGVDQFNYNGVQLKKCNTLVSVKESKLNIQKAAFEIIGSPVNFTGSYNTSNKNNPKFTASIVADEFDISKAYKEIGLFREMVPSASTVKGIVSLNYQLSGRLDNQMHPVLPSLKGGGVLTLMKVKLSGFKLLSAIKKHTGKEFDDNPDLSKIQLKTTVANNIMTLERTKLRIGGFKPRFQGQMSLDGKMNLQCRLGLPPFGLVGIPLSITGTQENPVVKFRRSKKSDALQETQDDADDEDKAEAEAAAAAAEGIM